MTPFVLILVSSCLIAGAATAVVDPPKKGANLKVLCSEQEMTVEVIKPPDVKYIYLEHLKHYPDKACRPRPHGDKLIFSLSLVNIFQCMVTKVVDREAGSRVYYHRVIVEKERRKEAFLVRCDSDILSNSTKVGGSTLVKRSAQFPVDFQEPDYEVEITSEVVGRAPIPELVMGVRQSGVLIDDELTVRPGTPLDMEIYLDNESADIYGVMVSKLEVTDSQSQNEILILNGCTVDPYLFENFLTYDGNLLSAKFKAFKFPESNYVLFKGVVNVCLDICDAVECANGQSGYGRRRRGIPDDPSDIQRIYEVSMSTVIRVDETLELPTRSVSQPQYPVSSRRRDAEFFVEKGALSDIFRPREGESMVKFAEEFGPKGSFVEFEYLEKSSASHSTVPRTSIFFATVFVSLHYMETAHRWR